MSISKKIAERLRSAGAKFTANDNIYEYIEDGELELLKAEVQEKFQSLLETLVIDTANDPNTIGTAERISRMYIDEVFSGRYTKEPKMTEFPNTRKVGDMIVIGSINVRSACSHHFAPFIGKAWVGVIPNEKLIGISKFSRLINWFATRPQIQEELTDQIANELEAQIQPKGLAVVIKATHECMTWRGVKETDSFMTTSVMRGLFRENAQTREEFLRLIGSK